MTRRIVRAICKNFCEKCGFLLTAQPSTIVLKPRKPKTEAVKNKRKEEVKHQPKPRKESVKPMPVGVPNYGYVVNYSPQPAGGFAETVAFTITPNVPQDVEVSLDRGLTWVKVGTISMPEVGTVTTWSAVIMNPGGVPVRLIEREASGA